MSREARFPVSDPASGPLRSASRQLLWVSSGALVYRVAALLLLAYYAKSLGPAGFGFLEQLLALSLLLAPIASLQAYEAFLSLPTRNSPEAASAAGSLLLSVMVIVLLAGWFGSLATASAAGAAVTAHVVSSITWQYFRNLLRASERYDVAMRAECWLSAVSLVVGVALLFYLQMGPVGALIGVASGNACAIIVARLGAPAVFAGIVVQAATKRAINSILAISARLVPNVILWWAIELSDRLILAYFRGDDEVGVYSASARIAGILLAVALLLYQVWQIPAIRAMKEGASNGFMRSSFRLYVVAISLCASALLVIAKPLTLLLFGEEYLASLQYTAVLVPAVFLAALCYFFGIVYYSPISKGAIKTSIIGFVASLAVNIAFIPRFGPLAAAFSSLIAYLLMCLDRHLELKRVTQVDISWSEHRWFFAIVAAQSTLLYMGVASGWLAAGTMILLVIARHDIQTVIIELRAAVARD